MIISVHCALTVYNMYQQTYVETMIMNRFKKLSAVVISVICLFSLASCGSTDGSGTAEETRTARGAMKVSKVTYCVYYSDRPDIVSLSL